jgi:hypothetical protein
MRIHLNACVLCNLNKTNKLKWLILMIDNKYFFTFIWGKCKRNSVTLTQHHVNAFGRVSVYILYTHNDYTYYQPILIS